MCLICIGLLPSDVDAQFFPEVKQKSAATTIGAYQEFDFPGSYLVSVAHSRDFQLRTWFTLGAEGVLYHFTQGQYSTVGIMLRPVTRLFVKPAPDWQIFAESKGGVIYMAPQYPDKSVNFVFVGSVGANWQYSKFNGLRLSVGYNHFSNGKQQGDAKNPTWDGLGLELSFVKVLQ